MKCRKCSMAFAGSLPYSLRDARVDVPLRWSSAWDLHGTVLCADVRSRENQPAPSLVAG